MTLRLAIASAPPFRLLWVNPVVWTIFGLVTFGLLLPGLPGGAVPSMLGAKLARAGLGFFASATLWVGYRRFARRPSIGLIAVIVGCTFAGMLWYYSYRYGIRPLFPDLGPWPGFAGPRAALEYIVVLIAWSAAALLFEKGKTPSAEARSDGSRPETEPPLSYADRLFLPTKAGVRLVALPSIKAIEADGDTSLLHLIGGEVLRIGRPLAHWIGRLPSTQFARIHRSHVVNWDHVIRIEPWSNYSYQVHLRERVEPLPLSRRYARALRNRLP